MKITAFDVAQLIDWLEEIYAALSLAEAVTKRKRTTERDCLGEEAKNTLTMHKMPQLSEAETVLVALQWLAIEAQIEIDRMRDPDEWDRRALEAQGITQQG